MAILGYDQIGDTDDLSSVPVATKFTAGSSGSITDIWIYCGSFSSTDYRGAVYADSSGAPGAKLAETSSAITASSLDWRSTPLSLVITSGTVYWLAFWASNTDARQKYHTGTTHQASAEAVENVYPTWPDPWSEVFALDREYSVYVVYTLAGGATPLITPMTLNRKRRVSKTRRLG